MLLIICFCFMNFLEHAIIHGEDSVVSNEGYPNEGEPAVIISNDGDSYDPERYPNDTKAYLPPHIVEYINGKSKKVIRKRSPGRVVTLPADVIKKLENVPFSTLSPDIEENRKIILDKHNEYRSKTNPPAANMLKLKWSVEAQKKAQEWANACKQEHSKQEFRTISKYRCSENLFLAPHKVDWGVVTDSWHSECQDFQYGVGSINKAEVGHYTLLVWAAVHEIGCAIAECLNLPNKYNYVCHMCPPGNKPPGVKPYELGKPCSKCPHACEGTLCNNPCNYADKFKNCKTFLSGGTCGSDQSLIGDCPAMCKCTNGEIKD